MLLSPIALIFNSFLLTTWLCFDIQHPLFTIQSIPEIPVYFFLVSLGNTSHRFIRLNKRGCKHHYTMTWTSFFEQMYTCKSVLAGIEIHTAFKASDNSFMSFFFYSLHWIKVLNNFRPVQHLRLLVLSVFIQRSASPSTNETQSPWPFHFLTMNNSPGPVCHLTLSHTHTHTKEIMNKDSLLQPSTCSLILYKDTHLLHGTSLCF